MKKTTMHVAVVMLALLTSVSAYGHLENSDLSDTKSLAEMAAERRTRPLSELSASELELFVYEREILRMFGDGAIKQAMDLFLAEDAMVFPPDSEFITGRDTQKEMFKAWLAMEGVELDWEPIDAFVSPSEDMGYVWGLVRWKNSDGPRNLGKYISVWAKIDGRWLNKMEIRNAIRVEN